MKKLSTIEFSMVNSSSVSSIRTRVKKQAHPTNYQVGPLARYPQFLEGIGDVKPESVQRTHKPPIPPRGGANRPTSWFIKRIKRPR